MIGSLSELRVWLIGGASSLRAGIAPICDVELVNFAHPAKRPHLLVVEGGERLDGSLAEQVDRVLGICERERVPRILWLVASPFDPGWTDRCRRFDRVFVVDQKDMETILGAGGRMPAVLAPATALPVDDRRVTGTTERPHPVIWLGGWRPDWPAQWRERVTAILDAAVPHGLTILGLDDPGVLPARLRDRVIAAPVSSAADALRAARLAIGADPSMSSPFVSPEVVFDAVACGTAAVSPHDRGMWRAGLWFRGRGDGAASGTQRNLVPAVVDRASAATEIERLLDDHELREATVHHARRIVAYNHTYANRLATLASAVGLRLVPDAP